MRKLSSILLLLVAIGCVQNKTADVTAGGMASGAPGIWADGKSSFPKVIHLSSDFSDAEATNITDMTAEWKTALNNQVTFFSISNKVSDISNNVSDLKSLNDDVMAVYKTQNWPADFPGSALAVTQIFGRGYNIGTASEYNVMYHADILINYTYTFRTDSAGSGYDLQTVVLHELGHFLGLAHAAVTADKRDTTIMYPSIRSWEDKRVPQTLDTDNIAGKYSLTKTPAPSGATRSTESHQYRPLNNDPGQEVHVIMELHANGDCIHKVNGAISKRHSVNLK
jgi:hypothetical protein